MLKIFAHLLLVFICISCTLFEPEQKASSISFVFKNTDSTRFEELKVIAYSIENGQRIAYDSTYHYPLKTPSIPYYSSAGISFPEQFFDFKEEGIFEAIAVKDDGTVFREDIGEINGKQTRRDFTIEVSNSGLKLK